MTPTITFIKNHWQMILIITLIYTLWQTDIIQPIRVLIVFLHELSHAIATVVTGGEVVEFAVWANESGHVMSRGGNRFITLTAGYLGSLLFGVLFFLVAVRTTWDRALLGLFGATMIFVALFYIRHSYPFFFAIITGGLMIAIAWFLSNQYSDLILRIVGLTSIIYVPYDIFSDTIRWSRIRSDARMLAEEFGGTTVMWGGLWLVVSLIVIGLCLRFGLPSSTNITFKKAVSEKTIN